MPAQPELFIGVQESGIAHATPGQFDIDTRFRMVKEAGVFDYYDKTPLQLEAPAYRKASEKHGIPIRAGGWFYLLGRDEPLLEWHLRTAAEHGTQVHNVQIFAAHKAGRPVTNDEVAALYMRMAELGAELGVTPCFEVHVNMWSEHFGRVARVAEMVERRGMKFNMTLDHSHVIFKIDNPEEWEVQNMRPDIESGAVVLDPFQPGSICQRWIDANYVRHMHARSAVPNGPRNVWFMVDGKPGRAIQYPFIRPRPGEWHSDWDESKLEPWKEVVRQFLRHHAAGAGNRTATISTEFIPWPDYGGNAKYSLFENSVACAAWIREEWTRLSAETSLRH